MLGKKLRISLVLTVLAASALGLGGCRRQDSTPPSTPPAQTAPGKQILPKVETGTSPLPAPGTGASPLKP